MLLETDDAEREIGFAPIRGEVMESFENRVVDKGRLGKIEANRSCKGTRLVELLTDAEVVREDRGPVDPNHDFIVVVLPLNPRPKQRTERRSIHEMDDQLRENTERDADQQVLQQSAENGHAEDQELLGADFQGLSKLAR